jgi:cytochrome c oxidase cbb3-type subunit 3
MGKDRDELKSSNYDGIREYDNDLPAWWLYLFYVTIVFGVVYTAYYELLGGPTQEQTLTAQMADIEAIKAAAKANAPVAAEQSEEQLLALVSSEERIEEGEELYVSRCASCHGQQAQGLIGPNLTDDHWIHGGTLKEIKAVIENGVLAKGMLAWKGILSDEEILNSVAFIHSVKGSNPPNPKTPEGEKVS